MDTDRITQRTVRRRRRRARRTGDASRDAKAVASPAMDTLVRAAVFGDGRREGARALADLGDRPGGRRAAVVDPRAVHGARPRRDATDSRCRRSTCAACRTTRRARSSARRSSSNAGAFILEIARSEIAYTDQRPAEYVAVMLAAAMREGFRGPVFIQGDHFQVNAKKYAADPDDRSRRGEGAGARGDRRRLLQHRHRHVDARRPLASRRSTSSSG